MTDKRKLLFFGDNDEHPQKKLHKGQGKGDQSRDPHGDHDPTIAYLARHMHRLREAVPVNQELKQQLKQKLKEELQKKEQQRKEQEKTGSEDGPPFLSKRKMIPFILSGLLFLFAACSVWLVFFTSETSLSVTEVVQLDEYEPQGEHSSSPVSIAADGNTVLVEQNGTIVRYQQSTPEEAELLLEDDAGDFHFPTWSNLGQQAAVIYEQEGQSQIWVWSPAENGSIRTVFQTEGARLASLTWSEEDEWLSVGKIESEGEARAEMKNGTESETESETDRSHVYLNVRTGEVLEHGMDDSVPDSQRSAPAELNDLLPKPELIDSEHATNLQMNEWDWPDSVRTLIEEAEQFWLDMNDDQQNGVILIEIEGKRSLLWFQVR